MHDAHGRMQAVKRATRPDGDAARQKSRGPAVTLAQLASFLTLARHGKQAAAEAALGKSQSQISRDLAALERTLGVRLLDRRERRLSAAGRRLLDYAAGVLRGWEALREGADDDAGGVGQAVLAAEPEVVSGALVPLLGAVRRKYPGLQVRLLARPAGALAGLLAAGETDLAVLSRMPAGTSGVSARPFLSAKAMLAVPSEWGASRRARLGLAALRGRTLVVPEPGSSLRAAVDAALAEAKPGRAAISEVGPGREAALAAAAAGLGAGFFLDFRMVPEAVGEPEPSRVEIRPAGPEFKPIEYSLAIRKSIEANGPAGLLVRELLRAVRKPSSG